MATTGAYASWKPWLRGAWHAQQQKAESQQDESFSSEQGQSLQGEDVVMALTVCTEGTPPSMVPDLARTVAGRTR
jgi:hypothetical protein